MKTPTIKHTPLNTEPRKKYIPKANVYCLTEWNESGQKQTFYHDKDFIKQIVFTDKKL